MTQQFNETYEEMVKSLFKPMPTLTEEILHAAVGLSGEVGELTNAMTRKNIIEECSDLEFYLEALMQKLPEHPVVVGGDPSLYGYSSVPLGLILTYMSVSASTLLDLAKKAWAYNKPLPVSPLHLEADLFRNLLDQLYVYLGTSKAEVRHLNQTKLMKRYPSGYTNEAAIARADKA